MMTSRVARIGLPAVLVVALGAYAWHVRSVSEDGLAALEALLDTSENRLFEARLGARQRHAPFSPSRGSGDTADRWSTAGRLEAFASAHAGHARLEEPARGLAHLHAGDVDAAIERLGDAAVAASDARIWTYLSAAYLARARPTDVLQAIEATAIALELDPALPSARFNQALALERAGLLEDALQRWTSWSSPAEPGWADEAATRAAAVARQLQSLNTVPSADDLRRASDAMLVRLAETAMDAVRRVLEEELLPGVGAACASADSPDLCGERRNRAIAVARALASVSTDRHPARLAEDLQRVAVDEIRDSGLAARLVAFGEASTLFARDEPTAAAARFRDVALPGPALAPLSASATLYLCLDEYYRSQHAAARSCLAALDAEAARDHYTFLRGRIHWLHGLISLTEGDLSRTAVDYDTAIAFMREAGDTNQAAIVESLRATLLDQLGSHDAAWQDRITVLSSARVDSRRRHTLLNSASRSCLLMQLPRAAHLFQVAAVRHAGDWGQPGALVESHLNQAVVFQRLRRFDDATAHLAEARRHFASIADVRASGRFEADLLLLQGEVLAERAPAEAQALLARAGETLTGMQFELSRLRLERAAGIASESLGDRPGARAAYARAVDVVIAQRTTLPAAAQAASIDLVWDVYERLLGQSLSDEDPLSGLRVAEAARAQVLHRFQADDHTPSELATLLEQLPDGVAVVYFATMADETVRWTLSNTTVTQERLPVGGEALEREVRRLRNALADGAGTAAREAGARLHDLVWPRPLEWSTVWVVPDGPLHDLPFGALVDPTTGRYLIQDVAVGMSPSLRMFVRSSRAARERFADMDSALVILGRTGATRRLEVLPALPFAREEAAAVAAVYPRARVVEGRAATPRAFVTDAGRFAVVHFTGHARADRRTPDLSRLFLAPEGDADTGWLLVRDLESATFDRTALVVLAACETGTGRVFKGEGVVSLARPFLARGVAGVVQTQWAVGDRPSARLLTAFHQGIGTGLEPVVALQQAQAALLSSPDAEALRTWPAYQYAGGFRGSMGNAGSLDRRDR